MGIMRRTIDSGTTATRAAFCIAPALISLTLGGCAAQSGVPSKIGVPADAHLLAYGAYPLPAFMPPRAGGTLYVFDEDTSRVAAVTSYAELPADGTGPESIIDVPGIKDSLDPKHHFRVYYTPVAEIRPSPVAPPAPVVAAPPATTEASPQITISAPPVATEPSTEPLASQPATEPAATEPATKP